MKRIEREMTMTTTPKTLTFADRLRSLREDRGWTQAELAARAGLCRQAVWRLESGSRRPGLTTLQQLAEALAVSVGDLLS